MAKTLFIHVWVNNDNGKEFMSEQDMVDNLPDSMTQYDQEEFDGITYLHTLMISYSDLLGQSKVDEINIKSFFIKVHEGKDYENVTGHEHGTNPGRV